MTVSATLARYLERTGARYALRVRPGAGLGLVDDAPPEPVPLNRLANALVLKDAQGLLMAVFPTTHTPDLEAIERAVGHRVKLALDEDIGGIFHDTEPGAIPPIGAAYGLRTVVDAAMLGGDDVYFCAGNHDFLVQVTAEAFRQLQREAMHGFFALPMIDTVSGSFIADDAPAFEMLNGLYLAAGGKNTGPVTDILARIERVQSLPPMPEMAERLFQLRFDPRADAGHLAQVIERDPALAAQVIRYAQSPLYGYRGRIDSIRDAISRVLGFDLVMNLALGIAAAGFMTVAPHGPLGRQALWRHAVYAATFVQALAKAMPAEIRPRVGTAYLAGLLNDIGILLLGHLHPQEFYYLNSVLSLSHKITLPHIEQALLGTGHAEMGVHLLRAWKMPDEVVVAVAEHHNGAYQGEHAVYSNLVLVADRLLTRSGIGHAESIDVPPDMFDFLQLPQQTVEQLLDELLERSEGLDFLAEQIAA